MKRFFALLLGFCLLTPTLSSAQTVARPSLWHVRGPQSDVYLLGSVHILPPGVQWRSQEIEQATHLFSKCRRMKNPSAG